MRINLKSPLDIQSVIPWSREVVSPFKTEIASHADTGNVVAAVLGTRPCIIGQTIFGRYPRRDTGWISFYTDSRGLLAKIKKDPHQYVYWERKRSNWARQQDSYPLYSKNGTTANSKLSSDKVNQKLYNTLKELSRGTSLEQAAYNNKLTGQEFIALMTERYPEQLFRFNRFGVLPHEEELSVPYNEKYGYWPN